MGHRVPLGTTQSGRRRRGCVSFVPTGTSCGDLAPFPSDESLGYSLSSLPGLKTNAADTISPAPPGDCRWRAQAGKADAVFSQLLTLALWVTACMLGIIG